MDISLLMNKSQSFAKLANEKSDLGFNELYFGTQITQCSTVTILHCDRNWILTNLKRKVRQETYLKLITLLYCHYISVGQGLHRGYFFHDVWQVLCFVLHHLHRYEGRVRLSFRCVNISKGSARIRLRITSLTHFPATVYSYTLSLGLLSLIMRLYQ